MTEKEHNIISGTVEEVVYTNPDNGYTVLHLAAHKDGELITVVGSVIGAFPGQELEVTGSYIHHPTYGRQFKAELFDVRQPSGAAAIFRYLASGAIKGIGPVMAARITDRFGDETLEVIEKTPERLCEIRGISPSKAESIGTEYGKIFGIRAVMAYLSSYGISPEDSIRIYKKWGAATIDRICENPYLLCLPELFLPFELAEEIAEKNNIFSESRVRVAGGLQYVLLHNVRNGHTCLPAHRLVITACSLLNVEKERVEEVLLDMIKSFELRNRMIEEKPFVYLPEYFAAEGQIVRRLKELAAFSEKSRIVTDIERLEKQQGITYASHQRKAVEEACASRIFILTGGPGTGKTTTVNGILSVFEENGKKVYLAAPTGRAAKRMSELCKKEATTIHRLLEPSFSESEEQPRFKRNEQNPLDCDVLVVDEMSMVDTMLFCALLGAIRDSCRLILVGDANQLPSVGAGNVLRDLLDSGEIPFAELTHIFRQAAQSLIVTNAHRILSGGYPELTRVDNDFFFVKNQTSSAVCKNLLEMVVNRLPSRYGLDPLTDLQVICPSKKGELGSYRLNKILQDRLNPEEETKPQLSFGSQLFRQGDKVMQIKNNYDLSYTKDGETGIGIFNGDIGFVEQVDAKNRILQVRFEERLAYYPPELLPELELAYAVTVHKSQGCEFDAVVIPLMEGFEKLYYRNLLYTAITRAKKVLVLLGTPERLYHMVDNNKKTVRFTGLVQGIREYFSEEQEE